MDFNNIFIELQSLCINFMKNPNLKTIQDLNKSLENIIKKENALNKQISVINDFKEYIALPLFYILKQDFKRYVLSCEAVFYFCLFNIIRGSMVTGFHPASFQQGFCVLLGYSIIISSKPFPVIPFISIFVIQSVPLIFQQVPMLDKLRVKVCV